jgi:KUP system potassium uptake protein
MFVTFFDTCMVTLAALIVWRLSPWVVFLPWLLIACVDCLYLSSALTKVPEGAWFTLTLAGVLASTFMLWRFGKEQQWQAEAEDRFQPTHLIKKRQDGRIQLTARYGGGVLTTIRGFGIFFDKAGEMTPTVFIQFVSKLVATPEVMVFFHLRPLETPSVPVEQRYTVSRFSIPGCYRLVIRHGFMDEVITPDLSLLVYEQVRDFIIRQGAVRKRQPTSITFPLSNALSEPKDDKHVSAPPPIPTKPPPIPSSPPPIPSSPPPPSSSETPTDSSRPSTMADDVSVTRIAELSALQQAFTTQVLYIIGKEQMKIKPGTTLWRRVQLSMFLWLRDNTRTKIANLRVETERVVEVGFVKEV